MQMNEERPKAAAWPVANPVVTCASASQAVPSNFVADPFLYVKVSFFRPYLVILITCLKLINIVWFI